MRFLRFFRHPPPTFGFFFFLAALPRLRGAGACCCLSSMHNACITTEAGAGRDILPRHTTIITTVRLGAPRIRGGERQQTVAPIKMLLGVVLTPHIPPQCRKSRPGKGCGDEWQPFCHTNAVDIDQFNPVLPFFTVSARETCQLFHHLLVSPKPPRQNARGEGRKCRTLRPIPSHQMMRGEGHSNAQSCRKGGGMLPPFFNFGLLFRFHLHISYKWFFSK